MEIVSVGPVDGGPEQLAQEFAAVSRRLAGSRLGVVYLPSDTDHRAYLRAAQDGLGGTVIGATTGGAAFTERGYSRSGVVGGVLGGRGFEFEVAVAKALRSDPEASIAMAAGKLVDASRRKITRAPAVLTLADAFSVDGEILLNALQNATPPHWRHFGATAGDNWTFSGTHVFADGEVYSDAAVMVGLFSDCAISLVAHHGWCAAEGSQEFTITAIEGNTIKALDDKPAAEAYISELRRLGLMKEGDDPLTVMAKHELGARTRYGNELKVRAPLAINDDGSVSMASGLPRGTVVRVVTASADQLITAAGELSRRALEPLQSAAVRGALVFDCAARLQLLRERYDEEVAAFLGGRSFPVIGLCGYGEIAKFGGNIEGFHNTTAVMAAW